MLKADQYTLLRGNGREGAVLGKGETWHDGRDGPAQRGERPVCGGDSPSCTRGADPQSGGTLGALDGGGGVPDTPRSINVPDTSEGRAVAAATVTSATSAFENFRLTVKVTVSVAKRSRTNVTRITAIEA